jgi:hypothetical protein
MEVGEKDMVNIDDLRNWSEIALLIFIAKQSIGIVGRLRAIGHEVPALIKDVKKVKSEVEKFLQPQIRFYIRDVLQRRIKMKDTEKAVAVIELDDAKGFPTGGVFDQPPIWAADDGGAIVALAPSADGMSCEVAGVVPGNAILSVAGVAGGVSYQGSVPVAVTAGDATQIKVTLGAPVPQ